MIIADRDLLSVQQARILAENAFEAQKRLAAFPQEKLDAVVEAMAGAVAGQAAALVDMELEETGCGNRADKLHLLRFVCGRLRQSLRDLRCVGVLKEDAAGRAQEIGVPAGVISVLTPMVGAVATAAYNALIAVKSGNAAVFSPHPRAARCTGRVLEICIAEAMAAGLPVGCLAHMDIAARNGTQELMRHQAVSLILITGVPGMYGAAHGAGKPVIYGGPGNGPSFVERTADVRKAAEDIVRSKTFENGTAPSAEHCVVVDAPIAREFARAMRECGAYFMTCEESVRLAELFFRPDGRCRHDVVGASATALAEAAGIAAPAGLRLLVAERRYVSDADPYSRAFPAPVLAWYVEDDWRHACEKCIELLLHEGKAHTLVVHSRDNEVIRQFALKKPVSRILVNTPAAFGGMGLTTDLFPALTLGSGVAGYGITSDNVSPLHLIYIRKVGYGIREAEAAREEHPAAGPADEHARKLSALRQLLLEAMSTVDRPVD